MQLRIAKQRSRLEDAVTGDKSSNGLVENAVMLLYGVIRTIKCHVESCTPRRLSNLAVVGGTCGEHLVQVPEGSRPLNRMNRRYNFGVWLGVKSNSAECFVGTAEGVCRAREVRRIEQQDRCSNSVNVGVKCAKAGVARKCCDSCSTAASGPPELYATISSRRDSTGRRNNIEDKTDMDKSAANQEFGPTLVVCTEPRETHK